MSIKLEDYEYFLKEAAPDVREVYAGDCVKRTFGANNYTEIDHVNRFPEQLPTLFARLTA